MSEIVNINEGNYEIAVYKASLLVLRLCWACRLSSGVMGRFYFFSGVEAIKHLVVI